MFQLSEKTEFITETFNQAKKYGVAHAMTTNKSFDGRTIQVHGRENIFLGNCGYLGLATHERIVEAAIEGIKNYGTFFSSSRVFAGLDLNEKLEDRWEQVFKRPCIVSPSTTMGHFSTLPVLVAPNDLIILDKQVHISVHTAAMVCKGQGTEVTSIQHSRLDFLEAKILDAGDKYNRIWYMADGVFSMFGDPCPGQELHALMDKYDNLYAYIDDSHGMSWDGENGVGAYLGAVDYHEKLFMALSTNKATATGGAVLVFPNQKLKEAVRNCGSTLVFSGPQSPASLNAGIVVAEMHLTKEFKELQENLMERILFFIERAKALNIPVIYDDKTPIFFIGTGSIELGIFMINKLQELGFFVDGAGYPSVPMNNAGLRVTLTNYLTFEDIERFLQTVAKLIQSLEMKRKFNHKEITNAFEPLMKHRNYAVVNA